MVKKEEAKEEEAVGVEEWEAKENVARCGEGSDMVSRCWKDLSVFFFLPVSISLFPKEKKMFCSLQTDSGKSFSLLLSSNPSTKIFHTVRTAWLFLA